MGGRPYIRRPKTLDNIQEHWDCESEASPEKKPCPSRHLSPLRASVSPWYGQLDTESSEYRQGPGKRRNRTGCQSATHWAARLFAFRIARAVNPKQNVSNA